MTSKAALKSYRDGWKRSAAFWREQNARDQKREDERNARERAIVAEEHAKAMRRLQIRPIADIARDGAAHDALGYPIMALWLACFLQAYEAAFPEAT
jgi:hypothetical protein